MHVLIEAAFTKWITSVFGWLIALVLANGAAVHVGNMLGYGKMPWREFPIAWKVMDVLLLAFNLTVIAGLAMRQPWGVYVLYAGILTLQFIPYTVFRSHFALEPGDAVTLNQLLVTEGVLLAVFAGLIYWQGHGGGI